MVVSFNKNSVKWVCFCIYISMSMMGNIKSLIGFAIFFIGDALITGAYSVRKFSREKYIIWQVAFTIFVLLSAVWARESVFENITTIVIVSNVIMAMYFANWGFYNLKSYKDIESALKAFVGGTIVAAVYAAIYMPREKWIMLDRLFLGDYGLTSHNTLGMAAGFGAGICVYFFLKDTKKRAMYASLFFVEVVIVILSGSRKGIMSVALFVGMFFILSARNVKVIRNAILIIGFIVGGYYLLISNARLYAIAGEKLQVLVDSIITESNVQDHSMSEREYFRTQAISLWLRNPIVGTGINGFRAYMQEIGYNHVTYSHCNYTELLANYGIIGFFLYYFYKIKIIICKFKDVRYGNDLSISLWVFAVIVLVLEYGFVSYYESWVCMIWIIIFNGIVCIPKREKQKIMIDI